jgi:hypothetical protein
VGTAYAIFNRDDQARDGSGVRQIEVVWSEAEAVERVARLNALGSEQRGPYYWQPAWVARREPEQEPSLTSTDRELLELARRQGVYGSELPIGVFCSFIFRRAGARAAVADLLLLGWTEPDCDEELDGDDCWHVWAHDRTLVLNEDTIVQLRTQMEDLAERHGGTFDGWDVSGQGLRSSTASG